MRDRNAEDFGCAGFMLILLIIGLIVVALVGCSTMHPFADHPKSDFGHRAKFNPGNALFVRLSCAPEVFAMDTLNQDGKRVPVKYVVIFASFRHPFEPWQGAHVTMTLTNKTRVVFSPAPDHSWALEAPFGIGGHEIQVDVVKDDAVLYTQKVTFAVFQSPTPQEWGNAKEVN